MLLQFRRPTSDASISPIPFLLSKAQGHSPNDDDDDDDDDDDRFPRRAGSVSHGSYLRGMMSPAAQSLAGDLTDENVDKLEKFVEEFVDRWRVCETARWQQASRAALLLALPCC